MTPEQLFRRDEIMAKAESIRENWPDRKSSDFQREMSLIAWKLESLAAEADDTYSDRLELARLWRFLGNAYFDLGDGIERGWLGKAADAFARSEALSLPLQNPVETIKLNYSFASALFHLASDGDWSLLQDARRRYARALQNARQAFPEGVSDLEEALANTDRVLVLLGSANNLTERIDLLQDQLQSTADQLQPPEQGAREELTGPIWESLKREFQEKRDSGEIDPDRAAGLADIMSALAGIVQRTRQGRTPAEGTIDRQKITVLQERMRPAIQDPSRGSPPAEPGTRAGRLIECLEKLNSDLGLENMQARKSGQETDMAIDLYGRLARLAAVVNEARDDDARLLRLEREQARPLMAELRWYFRRNYPALTRPVWSSRTSPPDPNLVFFSGPEPVRAVVENELRAYGLTLSHLSLPGANVAEARWDELRASGFAIFDLTGRRPQAHYELGMALATGVELLLIANTDTEIPFDVAQAVWFYSDTTELVSFLHKDLYPILYGVQNKGGEGSSVLATSQYAEQLSHTASPDPLVEFALQQLTESTNDPIEFRAGLAAFGGYLSKKPHVVSYPRWPVCYPNLLTPRCFVVMPFRPELDPVWSSLARECERAGVEPVRGDVVEGSEIIRSIWEEIGRATHVVGDLTGLNPNVCLELGIADTLGRQTFLISPPDVEKSLFSNLAKHRCHVYPPGPWQATQFESALRKFLGKMRGGNV